MTTSESQKIVDALVAAGWEVKWKGANYARLCHPKFPDDAAFTVPFDPAMGDYGLLTDEVIEALGAWADRGAVAGRALEHMRQSGAIA